MFERSDYVSRQSCVDISFINTRLLEVGLLKRERQGELLILGEKENQEAGESHIMRGLLM